MAQVLHRRTTEDAASAGRRWQRRRALDRLAELLGMRAQRTDMPMPNQPLHPMTAALQALLEQQRLLDQREVQERDRQAGGNAEHDMNLQAIEHLEHAIACVPADAPKDALVQLLIAAGHAQALEQDACELPLAGKVALVSRLLRSALPVLARDVNFDLDGFGASHYGLRRLHEGAPPRADVPTQPDEAATRE